MNGSEPSKVPPVSGNGRQASRRPPTMSRKSWNATISRFFTENKLDIVTSNLDLDNRFSPTWAMRNSSKKKLQAGQKAAEPNSFVLKILISKLFAIKILQSVFLRTPAFSIF